MLRSVLRNADWPKSAVRSTSSTLPFPDFIARSDFEFDSSLKWFPHHMAKARVAIPKKLPIVDMVIEVRDARLPLTSAQFELDELVKSKIGRHRIVVLNKQDLVPKSVARTSSSVLELQGTPVLCTSAINNSNVSQILSFITENVRVKFKSLGVTLMVTGLPNTGKSTLLNALKSAAPHPALDKAPAKTSGIPGSTVNVNRIQINSHHPKIYVLDTPGVMLTRTGLVDGDPESGPELMMKLASVGCMPDTVPGIQAVADFILFQLNKRGAFKYVEILKMHAPTNNLEEVVSHLSKQVNGEYGRSDFHGATHKFVSMFRSGVLGKICLDDLPDPDLVLAQIEKANQYLFETEPPGPWGPSQYPTGPQLLRSVYKSKAL